MAPWALRPITERNAVNLIVSVFPTGSRAEPNSAGGKTIRTRRTVGVIFNDTTSPPLGSASASFMFASEQGVIVGWNGAAGAGILADRSAAGAVYKGLATATRSGGPLLYATDFANARVDVFDGNMNLLSLPGAFTDANIPAGFAPFNIQNLGGSLYVSYAKQDAKHHDDVAGPGNGYVDVYDLNGLPNGWCGGPANRLGAWPSRLRRSRFRSGARWSATRRWHQRIRSGDWKPYRPVQDGTGATIRHFRLWGLMSGTAAAQSCRRAVRRRC
jgi:hypothetical protein